MTEIILLVWAILSTCAACVMAGVWWGSRRSSSTDPTYQEIKHWSSGASGTLLPGWEPDMPSVIQPEPTVEERVAQELSQKSLEQIREGLIREYDLGGEELEAALREVQEHFQQTYP